MMLVKVLIVAQVPQQITDFMVLHVANKYAILLILNIFLIFIGMIVDDVNAALLAASLFLPLVKTLGVHPVHFGAILAVNLGLGALTPPVCANLLMASRITNIPVMDFFRDVVPFIIFAFIPTLFLVTYIPSISLTLPTLLGMVR